MLRSVFSKTVWDQRRVMLSWAIGITAVGVGYAAFYPAINSPQYLDMLASFPEGVLDAMGFADIGTAAGYLGSTTFGLLGPALIIVMAAALGASAIAGDEESGRLDLTLAHPVSRWAVVVQRFAALIVAMVLVCAVLTVALLAISGPAQLDQIGPLNLAGGGLHLALLGVAFGALALAVGAATGRRSPVYAVVAIVAVVGFFGNNLGPSVEGLAWLRDISPFHYYSGGVPLRNGVQLADVAVLVAASIILVIGGGLRFDRRDIAV
jgi:ABC-2 type transport system permease protein